MKIIISPAKKMNRNTDFFPAEALPEFIDWTETLLRQIRRLDFAQCRELWQCNENLARQNFSRFQTMELRKTGALTPALLAYEGIQYQYLSPMTLETGDWEYVRDHLRILSGFYGVLRPFDGVVPYRLEMQARLEVKGDGGQKDSKNLYGFWGDALYRFLADEERLETAGGPGRSKGSGGQNPVIVNLASKEYSKCIEPYLEDGARFITCVFGEKKDGKIRQKATQAKMARGEMVRFMAQNRIEDPQQIKNFDRLGFVYSEENSADELEEKGRAIYTFLTEGD